MPRQTGTVAVARRPPVPDAASKKKKNEPNVQETLCQEDMRDKTRLHNIDVPETPDDAGMHADNACQQAMYETYREEAIDKTCLEKTAVPRNIANGGPPNNYVLSQTGTVDDAGGPAVPSAASERGKHDVQETLCLEGIPSIPDIPRTTAHNISNTKGHQTNSWQTSPRQEFAAAPTLANYDEEFAAATLANYDEEFAATPLATYDEEIPTATLATYDEELAAATTPERGSPRVHN
jgi:hypothetical protein